MPYPPQKYLKSPAYSLPTLIFIILLIVSIAFTSSKTSWAQDGSLRDRVYQAAMATYIHGMTDEIAQQEFGPEAVPVLIDYKQYSGF